MSWASPYSTTPGPKCSFGSLPALTNADLWPSAHTGRSKNEAGPTRTNHRSQHSRPPTAITARSGYFRLATSGYFNLAIDPSSAGLVQSVPGRLEFAARCRISAIRLQNLRTISRCMQEHSRKSYFGQLRLRRFDLAIIDAANTARKDVKALRAASVQPRAIVGLSGTITVPFLVRVPEWTGSGVVSSVSILWTATAVPYFRSPPSTTAAPGDVFPNDMPILLRSIN